MPLENSSRKKFKMNRSTSRLNEESSSTSLLPSFKMTAIGNNNNNKLLSLQNTNNRSYIRINKNKTNEKINFFENKSKSYRNLTYEYI